jgi:hypothetical protein
MVWSVLQSVLACDVVRRELGVPVTIVVISTSVVCVRVCVCSCMFARCACGRVDTLAAMYVFSFV